MTQATRWITDGQRQVTVLRLNAELWSVGLHQDIDLFLWDSFKSGG